MYKLRLRYSKTGKAKYISHLDLMATMRRALLRAGIKLQYSEGFNPHPYMSVALPLSVGCSSVCELMDFGTPVELLPDNIPSIVNTVLPEGIQVLEAYSSERGFNDIAWIRISGTLFYDAEASGNLTENLTERFASESIIIRKKTKRGISDIDIAPLVKDVQFYSDGRGLEIPGGIINAETGKIEYGNWELIDPSIYQRTPDDGIAITMAALISAQNPSINPGDLINAFNFDNSALMPAFSSFTRTAIYDGSLRVFR